MNKMKILLAVGVAAVASQAAGSLWGPDKVKFPSFQVQVPCVTSNGATTDITGDGVTDYLDCAGWWFGYNYGPTPGTYGPVGADGKLRLNDPTTGDAWPDGALASGTSMDITLTAPAGKDSDPNGAGVGFNFKNPEGPEDITSFGGYCLVYSLTGDALKLEIGWNEAVIKYDTWTAPVPVAATSTVLNLPWSPATGSTTAGSFTKIGYAKNAAEIKTITEAVAESWSMKIKLENKTATPKSSTLKLMQVGKAGECGAVGIASSVASKASMNAALVGRTLSFSGFGKVASVDVISIQGQVVAHKTINAASKSLDLSKMASGVYVVKAATKDQSFNKMIVLK